MEIGTEISQKIRSAIKAKLIELGAYVDDELPDYIMVMVANKKTQKQMTDDLSLFLSTNTEKFTSWLHSLLKKLQSINTEPTPSSGKHKTKEKHKAEKKKRKASHGDKEKVIPTAAESQTANKSEKSKRKSTEDKLVEAVKVKHSSSTTHLETNAEINISENTDEFAEETKEVTKKEQTKGSSSTGKPPPAKLSKSDKSCDVSKAAIKSAKEHSTRSHTRSGPSKLKEEVSSRDSKKKPSSFVASVKRKYEVEDEEEEYDPLNPAVGSVASIVHGPSRKSSIPKSLQANKSLLMKAVTEAEKSVTKKKQLEQSTVDSNRPGMKSDHKRVELKHRLKTAAGLQLMSRSKRSKSGEVGGGEPTRKSAKTGETFENLKYTVRNVSAPGTSTKKAKPAATAPSRVAATALRDLTAMKKELKRELAETAVASDSDTELQADAEEGDESEQDDEGSESSVDEMAGDSVDEVEVDSDVSRVDSEVDSGDSEVDGEDSEVDGEDSEVDNDVSEVDKANSEADSEAIDNDDQPGSEDQESDEEELEIEITDRAAQTTVNMRDKQHLLARVTAETTEKDCQTDVKEIGLGESSSYKLSKAKMEEIDGSLLNMFIENLLPFNFVENEAFRMFAKTLEPKYHFPKRKKLVTEVGMLYNTVKDSLKTEVADVQSVVFTHSSWCNMDDQLYDTVTVHYISDAWLLRTAALRTCTLSNDPRSIAEYLQETRLKWNLPQPILVSEGSEFENRVSELLEWDKVTCFGNCIHYVIKHCLGQTEVSSFIKQGEKLVSEVINNGLALDMFQKKKKLLLSADVQQRKLVLSDGESWSSVLEMITVLSEQTAALHAAVMDSELISHGVDLRNLLYAFTEQSVLESLVKILTPFKTATEILTKQDGPTLQKVIPIFVKLEKALEVDTDDTGMIKDIKAALRHRIGQYFQSCRNTCLLACLVHPQTKQMAFVSHREKEEVKNLLFIDIKAQCDKEFRENQSTEAQFRKGKKPVTSRQTKAMSEVVDDTDVRHVIVNKEEESGTDGADDTGNEGGTQTGDNDTHKARSRRKSNQDGDGADENKETGSRKSITRNVKKLESSDASQLGSLSVTVENDWLDDVICASDDQRSPEETAKIELNLYMAEPASNKHPLSWWKDKSALYPHISRKAKRLLAIPASSISTEEAFKISRNLETRQMQIKSDHIDMMLFLKKNKFMCECE